MDRIGSQEIGQMLQQAMQITGRSAKAIALDCGASESAVSRWISGEQSPSIAVLCRLDPIVLRTFAVLFATASGALVVPESVELWLGALASHVAIAAKLRKVA